jgi:Dyp-type peroxidase family
MTQVERVTPGSNYTVRPGDSLFLIAQRAYNNAADWPIIYEANRQTIGLNPDVLHTGQVLTVPAAPSSELHFREVQPIPSAPSGDVRALPIPPAPSPDLPLKVSTDIQGDVLAPFNKDNRVYLFYAFPDQASGRAWLVELIPSIANTNDVASFNAAFSAARAANGGVDPPNMQATWVNVSLTFSGLTTLINANTPVASEITSWSAHFASGPADPTVLANNGDTGASDPKNWKFGSDNRIHAMLNIQSDDPTALAAKVQELQSLADKHGMNPPLFEQDGATLPMPQTGHEHFGFRDGISQPGVNGFDPPEQNDPNSDPSAPLGHVAGHPQAEIIQAGEFILGEPVEPDFQEQQFPPPELQHLDWMKNGSFQVVRRLNQDVPGFWNEITSALPADGSVSEDLVGAKVIGRWKSGTPIDLSADQDNNFTLDTTINNFIYQGDPQGLRCPHFAHIRKVYPREHDSFGDRAKRILRRGVPFGPAFVPGSGSGQDANQERGLFFVAYMARIERQFEFLMLNWARNSDFPSTQTGLDPVIGASDGGTCTIERQGQPPIQLQVESFVTTTGTLYAFVPSLTALSQLANGQI